MFSICRFASSLTEVVFKHIHSLGRGMFAHLFISVTAHCKKVYMFQQGAEEDFAQCVSGVNGCLMDYRSNERERSWSRVALKKCITGICVNLGYLVDSPIE